MTIRKQIGNLGEQIASEYLEKKKYKIIARNYRVKWGDEIDIVTIGPKKVLTFVEVKTIYGTGEGILKPEDNLTSDKVYKLKRVCQFYANKNPKLVGDRGWQIDVIAIEISSNYLTDLSNDYLIRHYENI